MAPWAWWLVWTVLVAATLAGALVLGRSLWRRGVALAHAASAAADAASRLSKRTGELAAAARERNPVPPVALVRDAADLRTDVAAARDRRERRVAARRARYPQVWDRWRDVWR